MGSGAGYYYSGLGGEDCYYLVLGDSMKVQGFIDQTVDILQERVRSNPIPVVTELNQEEEELLMKQIKIQGSEETISVLSFQLAQDEKGKFFLALNVTKTFKIT
ncbi:uncharacterized protein LOC111698648 [Eurytemora carolleeae]|uniref:uncharacterized protein LOC111698648 n=1 Tax=Eurytemora carolleeae TaxID=1294199 RepID=UPI000C778A18|nr:uncharacterized protein LOC111698648 [Eurytemora carolleeae]|eukprot:XP_023324801.1 uncharacterized protein LOC111698648 [Eurytemora affinis]